MNRTNFVRHRTNIWVDVYNMTLNSGINDVSVDKAENDIEQFILHNVRRVWEQTSLEVKTKTGVTHG